MFELDWKSQQKEQYMWELCQKPLCWKCQMQALYMNKLAWKYQHEQGWKSQLKVFHIVELG